MASIMVRVTDAAKELWVEAAHDERVSLSEWIRRRCDGALVAGDGEAVVPIGAQPGAVSRDLRPSPATSARPFRADPKNGAGLGSGEVSVQSPPVVAAVSPEPSPLDAVSPDSTQGVRVGKTSFRPDPKKKP